MMLILHPCGSKYNGDESPRCQLTKSPTDRNFSDGGNAKYGQFVSCAPTSS
jgi:hypothetical protein